MLKLISNIRDLVVVTQYCICIHVSGNLMSGNTVKQWKDPRSPRSTNSCFQVSRYIFSRSSGELLNALVVFCMLKIILISLLEDECMEGCFKTVASANVLLIALVSWRTSPITNWSVCEQNWCSVVILFNPVFINLFLLTHCKGIKCNAIRICIKFNSFTYSLTSLSYITCVVYPMKPLLFLSYQVSAVNGTNRMSFKQRDLFLMKLLIEWHLEYLLSHYIKSSILQVKRNFAARHKICWDWWNLLFHFKLPLREFEQTEIWCAVEQW